MSDQPPKLSAESHSNGQSLEGEVLEPIVTKTNMPQSPMAEAYEGLASASPRSLGGSAMSTVVTAYNSEQQQRIHDLQLKLEEAHDERNELRIELTRMKTKLEQEGAARILSGFLKSGGPLLIGFSVYRGANLEILFDPLLGVTGFVMTLFGFGSGLISRGKSK